MPRPPSGEIPLSLAQQRLWLIDQVHGGSVAYNNVLALRLSGPVNAVALVAALTLISERHEALRTRFPSSLAEPRQLIDPPGPLQVRQEDLSGFPAQDRDKRASQILAQEQLRPYDLAQGPLTRYLLIRLDAAAHVLAVSMHHIICDAGSFDVICGELARFYPALAAGQEVAAEPLPLQYADYALWQRAMAESGRWDSQLRFWREQLAGASTALRLPADHARPASPAEFDDRSATHAFSLGADLTSRVLRLCNDVGATPFMALFTVFCLLLCRYQAPQCHDVVVGVPFEGRFDRRLRDLVGMFINTLAVRIRCPSGQTVRELLISTRDVLLESYGNADVPFDWVVRELRPDRDLRHNPLFQVTFQLQHADSKPIRIGDLAGTWFPPAAQPAKFDLSFNMVLAGGDMRCEITYAATLFEERTIALLADEYRNLISAVTADPGLRVGLLMPQREAATGTAGPTPTDPAPAPPSVPARQPATAMEALLAGIFADTLGLPGIGPDDSFFALGGHSLLAIKLMRRVSKETGLKIPVHAVFSRPSVAGLAGLLAGQEDRARMDMSADLSFVADAVLDPAIRPPAAGYQPGPPLRNVLLTGSTGLLGCHVLAQVLRRSDARVWCLVRAADEAGGLARIQAALTYHRLWADEWRPRIAPVCADLAAPRLKLAGRAFDELAELIDVVYHVGAHVNLIDPYDRASAVNVAGTQEILRLAARHHAKPVHYVSTLSTVAGGPDDPEVLPEDWHSDPARLVPNGYLRSKWVAEQLVRIAQSRGMPTIIYRPTRICGDSRSGAMSHSDALWHYVRACVELEAMPVATGPAVNLVPVDFAAAAFTHLALTAEPHGQAYSLSAPHDSSLAEILGHVRDGGYPMREVTELRWTELLGAATEQRLADAGSSVHAVALLDSVAAPPGEAATPKRVSRDNLERDLAGSGIACPPVDREVIGRYLRFFRESGFLPLIDSPRGLAREPAPSVAGHWREILRGYGMGLPLGIERCDERDQQENAARLTEIVCHLLPAQAEPLRSLAGRCGVSVESALHAFAALQLHRYTGSRDIVYGAAAGLLHATCGPAQPIRVDVADVATPAQLARDIQQKLTDLGRLPSCSLRDIAAWTGRADDDPLMTAVVSCGRPEADPDAAERATQVATGRRRPLHINFADEAAEGSIAVRFRFDPGRFARADVEMMAAGLIAVIAAATAPGEQATTIGDLLHRTWPTSAGQARGRGASREHAEPAVDFIRRFDAVVKRNGKAVAVRQGADRRSFARLDQESRAVAAALERRGIGPGSRVAVYLTPGGDLLALVIGVLRAGAAFVPIDPRHGGHRTEQIMMSADVSLTVHGDIPPPAARPTASIGALLSEGAAIAPGCPQAPPVNPAAAAYVIFTSGSTGEPKGVQVSRGSLAGYVSWAAARYLRFGANGTPLFGSIAFDLTLTQVFVPLAAGRTIDVVPPGEGIEGVAALLAQGTGFDFVKLTPSHARLLIATLEAAPARGEVACLVFGGEQLPADVVRAWRRLRPDTVIVNEYGPTEATVGCCVHEISPAEPVPRHVPIGLPAPGAVLRVLDERGDPVPDGVPGELHIGGPCLADGYFGKSGLTAAGFIADQLAGRPARLYRTGDRVRWQADGLLSYLGRGDDQIKIRGHRIEPEEVEAAIRECVAVADCAVTCWRRQDDDLRLVANVVPRAGWRWDEAHAMIVSFLAQRLPPYLIPAHLVPATAIPRSPSGKADRRSLRMPASG